MNRIEALNRRYTASRSLVRTGAEIVAVGDPPGARMNLVVRKSLLAARNDDPAIWDDLVGAAKALRWLRVTQPQPAELNPAVRDAARELALQVQRMRGATANDQDLDELAASAAAMSESDSPVGAILLRSIEEVGADSCLVVAPSKKAQAAMEAWLSERGVTVLTAGELDSKDSRVNLAYVVGPPRFYPSALVTAPVTSEISFLMPAWYTDRAIPRSAIAPYAEGAIAVGARVLTEGDVMPPDAALPEIEDELLPEPVWGTPHPPDRQPGGDEVEAHKVLLSGNSAVWLDDGDRIRALDPTQPAGERVTYIQVDAVRDGTYLLLRQGETEHGALYQEALALLGKEGVDIDGTQRTWKRRLAQGLSELGYHEVVLQLKAAGVRTADRARAWTDPNLIRPNGEEDFHRLLGWLGIPLQPTLAHANGLRRMLYQASADIREELETAISATDLSELELCGHMSLGVETEGVRGILAARVLAISPHVEIRSRHETRLPFEDRGGRWLE